MDSCDAGIGPECGTCRAVPASLLSPRSGRSVERPCEQFCQNFKDLFNLCGICGSSSCTVNDTFSSVMPRLLHLVLQVPFFGSVNCLVIYFVLPFSCLSPSNLPPVSLPCPPYLSFVSTLSVVLTGLSRIQNVFL